MYKRQAEAFRRTCVWLESLSEPKSLQEVEEYMSELVDEKDMYTRKWLKKKLLQKYGESVSFLSDGYRDIISFKDITNQIINDRWYADRKKDIVEEKYRIIKAAAKLIQAEIREMRFDKSFYPAENLIADVNEGLKCVPKSLRLLLDSFIESKEKQNSLGQCIVYAARPKSAILPVPFGVGVEMDHVFGSRWLNSQLFDLGFSISDDEVKLFKQSVLQAGRVEDIIPSADIGFTQWDSDNADHLLSLIHI